jgi:ligand-binding sensor domain-containing protein
MPDVNWYYSERNDSIIYIATNFGLYRISNNNFHLARETCDDKLPLEDIRSLFKKDNKLWIFGEKGLYVFDEKSRQGRTYTVEDGLPQMNSVSLLLFLKQINVSVGTANGLVSFLPGPVAGIGLSTRRTADRYLHQRYFARSNSKFQRNKEDQPLI